MAQERVILLASPHGEADEVARRVSLLEGKLAVARQARDVVEAKLSTLADKAVTTDQRREEAKGQCEHLVEELTLLQLRGAELCLAIVGARP
jgi:uncharacterized protein YigA (DUF484 family)